MGSFGDIMTNSKKIFFWYFMEYILIFLLLGAFIYKKIYPEFTNALLIAITYLFIFTSTIILIKLALCIRNTKNYKLLIPLFILNIIYIPFYYNKYMEEKKTKFKYVSSFLLVFTILVSVGTYKYVNEPIIDLHKKITSDDDLISVLFPNSYNKCNYNETYDLECTDEENNIITMIVNYKNDEIKFDKPETTLIEKYYEVLKNNNETLKEDGNYKSFSTGNKGIIQKKYLGVTDNLQYYFILSSVKYHNSDFMSLVIQVIEEKNYKNQKNSLEDIIFSISKAQ